MAWYMLQPLALLHSLVLHLATSLTMTSLPEVLHISNTAIKINWPKKSTRAEWIGSVYELESVLDMII